MRWRSYAALADRPTDFALHGPTIEWCVVRFGVGLLGAIDPLKFWVEDHDIGKAANGERAAAFQSK